MKTLSEMVGHSILIAQPSVFKRYFEILLEEKLIGNAIAPKWYSTSLEVELFKGKWIFYKPSFWRSTIEIKESNRQLPFARYVKTRFKSEGTIELPRGQRLKIVVKPLKGICEVLDIRNKKLLSIKQNVSFKEKAGISIEVKSELLDKYPWVMVLAWLISNQHRRGNKN